jgi:hypothetical protein
VQVEAFVPELTVEGLDVGVLDGLSWLDEAQPDAGALRPFEHRPAGAFGAVVEDDLLRETELEPQFIEEPGHPCAGDRHVDDLARAEPAMVVDDVQHPEPA